MDCTGGIKIGLGGASWEGVFEEEKANDLLSACSATYWYGRVQWDKENISEAFMENSVKEYIEKYPSEIQVLFLELRGLVYSIAPQDIEEKLWAKLPSYYMGPAFIRLIPFKDHINVEASAISEYRSELEVYKVTPKGMLQLYLSQTIPCEILSRIFRDTLCGMK